MDNSRITLRQALTSPFKMANLSTYALQNPSKSWGAKFVLAPLLGSLGSTAILAGIATNVFTIPFLITVGIGSVIGLGSSLEFSSRAHRSGRMFADNALAESERMFSGLRKELVTKTDLLKTLTKNYKQLEEIIAGLQAKLSTARDEAVSMRLKLQALSAPEETRDLTGTQKSRAFLAQKRQDMQWAYNLIAYLRGEVSRGERKKNDPTLNGRRQEFLNRLSAVRGEAQKLEDAIQALTSDKRELERAIITYGKLSFEIDRLTGEPKKLGSGGMGKVYLMKIEGLDFYVAAKEVDPKVSTDDDLQREFDTATKIIDPNVVQFYCMREFMGKQFALMEYMQDKPQELQDHLGLKKDYSGYVVDTKGVRLVPAFSEEHLLDLALQLAKGLSAIHAAGIGHRDLKPANALVDAKGRLIIIDFGIASNPSSIEGGATSVGSLKGTPWFMDPYLSYKGKEIKPEDKQKYVAASDIWALGIVLYIIKYGKHPFSGHLDNLVEYLDYARRNQIPRPEGVNENDPFFKMLQRMTNLRYSPATGEMSLDRPSIGIVLATLQEIYDRIHPNGTGTPKTDASIDSLMDHAPALPNIPELVLRPFDDNADGEPRADGAGNDTPVSGVVSADRTIAYDETAAGVVMERLKPRPKP